MAILNDDNDHIINQNNNITTTTTTTTTTTINNTTINNTPSAIITNNNNNQNSLNGLNVPIDDDDDITSSNNNNNSFQSIEMNMIKPNNLIIVKSKIYLFTDPVENKYIQTPYPHQISHLIGSFQFQQIIDKINEIQLYTHRYYKWIMITSLILSILLFTIGIILKFNHRHDTEFPVSTIVLFIIAPLLFIVFSSIPIIKSNKRISLLKEYLVKLNLLFKGEMVFKAQFNKRFIQSCNDKYPIKKLLSISIDYPTLHHSNNHQNYF